MRLSIKDRDDRLGYNAVYLVGGVDVDRDPGGSALDHDSEGQRKVERSNQLIKFLVQSATRCRKAGQWIYTGSFTTLGHNCRR
jgi:hypothetical protein